MSSLYHIDQHGVFHHDTPVTADDATIGNARIAKTLAIDMFAENVISRVLTLSVPNPDVPTAIDTSIGNKVVTYAYQEKEGERSYIVLVHGKGVDVHLFPGSAHYSGDISGRDLIARDAKVNTITAKVGGRFDVAVGAADGAAKIVTASGLGDYVFNFAADSDIKINNIDLVPLATDEGHRPASNNLLVLANGGKNDVVLTFVGTSLKYGARAVQAITLPENAVVHAVYRAYMGNAGDCWQVMFASDKAVVA